MKPERKQRSGQLKIGNCIVSETKGQRRGEWRFDLSTLRMREIEAVIRARHGQFLPETDDAYIYVEAAALALNGQDIKAWCRYIAPWFSPDDANSIAARFSDRKYMQSADACAALLHVTDSERRELRLKTIGACDLSRADRLKLAKQRKRDRDKARSAQKRTRATGMDRKTFESNSLTSAAPWKAVGVSRSTWYRLRETGPSRVVLTDIGDTPVSKPESYTAQMPTDHGQERAANLARGLGHHAPAGVSGAAPLRGEAA